MELREAVKIVKSLSRGIDPESGQAFPLESPYNHPSVIRAIVAVLNAIPKYKKTAEERRQDNMDRGLPRNAGLPWTEEERKSVAEIFNSGASIREIAEIRERSKTSIIAELNRQGLISNEEVDQMGIVLFSHRASHSKVLNATS